VLRDSVGMKQHPEAIGCLTQNAANPVGVARRNNFHRRATWRPRKITAIQKFHLNFSNF